jgi:hypothetical protein
MSTSWNLDITYPEPFSLLLGMLSVFSLDFLAIECFQEDVANRFFTTVYLWSSLPILLGVLIFLVCGARILFMRCWGFGLGNDDIKLEHNRIINQHVWCALLLSYLVLPPGK